MLLHTYSVLMLICTRNSRIPEYLIYLMIFFNNVTFGIVIIIVLGMLHANDLADKNICTFKVDPIVYANFVL